MGIQFPSLVADDRDLEAVPGFEVAHQLDHLRVRLGLREHKLAKLGVGERSFSIEYDSIQIFLKGKFPLLERIEGQMVSFLHL
jgi:hypothetical protein